MIINFKLTNLNLNIPKDKLTNVKIQESETTANIRPNTTTGTIFCSAHTKKQLVLR